MKKAEYEMKIKQKAEKRPLGRFYAFSVPLAVALAAIGQRLERLFSACIRIVGYADGIGQRFA